MTKARLQLSVLLVITGLTFLLVAAMASKFYFHSEEGYSVIKDFSPLLIAIAAAYLAYTVSTASGIPRLVAGFVEGVSRSERRVD